MKYFKYKILNPGGNKTALVIGNNYLENEKKLINVYILRENKDVEQVGFISNIENKLEMAGGEFCVNATRCAIWEYLENKENRIEINVSGDKNKIDGWIDKQKNVYVKLKINKEKTKIINKEENFTFVNLDRILLTILDEDNSIEFIQKIKSDEEKTKDELKKIMKRFKTKQNAIGIILLEKNNEKLKIFPIIWVKTIDTLFYETACGSGSLAVAIYKNYTENISSFEILQPSGYSINVKLNVNNDYIEYAIVSGKVIEENGGIKYGRI